MTIWILNHYAAPPDSHVGTRHYDFGRELVRKGHHVTIFASGFNRQTFLEERLGKGQKWKLCDYDDVTFLWVRTTPYRGNSWSRVMNMMSYASRAVWVGKSFKDRPDIIIGSSVHPFAVLSAYILSKMKKSRFFFEVRDLWPQTLIDMGELSEKSPLAWALRVLEKYLYRKAEKIITLLPYAGEYMAQLGIAREKIVWIPNQADLSRYAEVKKYEGSISAVFTIMYLGAHGRANALDVILNAAKILQDQGMSYVRFVFVGDGPEKNNLIARSVKLGLKNIRFCDAVSKDEIATVMGKADAFVVCLQDIPVYKYGISLNKLFDYLASGRPILMSGNPANNPVDEAKAGITVPPCDPEALANAVIELVNLEANDRIKMGKNGLEYVRNFHDLRLLGNKLEDVLLA